jgi:hypothetical protein
LQALSQQRPLTQLLLRQSVFAAQVLPSARGASTQLPFAAQRWPLAHTASQQISLAPCRAAPHSPERQSPFKVQAAPSASKHWPRPAHCRLFRDARSRRMSRVLCFETAKFARRPHRRARAGLLDIRAGADQ